MFLGMPCTRMLKEEKSFGKKKEKEDKTSSKQSDIAVNLIYNLHKKHIKIRVWYIYIYIYI